MLSIGGPGVARLGGALCRELGLQPGLRPRGGRGGRGLAQNWRGASADPVEVRDRRIAPAGGSVGERGCGQPGLHLRGRLSRRLRSIRSCWIGGEIVHEWRASFNAALPSRGSCAGAAGLGCVGARRGTARRRQRRPEFRGARHASTRRAARRSSGEASTQSHHALDLLPDGEVLIASRRQLAERARWPAWRAARPRGLVVGRHHRPHRRRRAYPVGEPSPLCARLPAVRGRANRSGETPRVDAVTPPPPG